MVLGQTITVPTLWLFALIMLPLAICIFLIVQWLVETVLDPIIRRKFAPKPSIHDWDEDDEEMDNEDLYESQRKAWEAMDEFHDAEDAKFGFGPLEMTPERIADIEAARKAARGWSPGVSTDEVPTDARVEEIIRSGISQGYEMRATWNDEHDKVVIEGRLPTVKMEAISSEQAYALFDNAARRYMKMSGEEFLAQWGKDKCIDYNHNDVIRVFMLLPFSRKEAKDG